MVSVSTIAAEADARARLAEQERRVQELEAKVARLEQRIRLLEKALFGPRSERLRALPSDQGTFEQLLKEAAELNQLLEQQQDQLTEQRQQLQPRSRAKRRNLQELIPADLPREEITLDVPAEERVCLETGEPLVRIGEERVEKLAYRPPSWFVKVFIYPKYASAANPAQGVLCAPAPDFAIPGGLFDESFLAGVAVDKCAYHLPLYRQEERLLGAGIEVSRQTLSRLYIRTAEVLAPLYALLKQEILKRGILFTDDTPVQLQVKGMGKTVTGRMWVYVAGGAGPPYRVFEFTVDRRKCRPKEFLEGFRGFIHADAYKGYDDLFAQPGVHECACWMHVRRKFLEAEDAPVELRQEVLRSIRHLFRYERLIAGRDPSVVLRVRSEKTAPLIDRLFERTARALTEGEVLPASAFAAAVGYLHNLGAALRTFLGRADLRADNGESERAIRPLAIGRKNWLFAGSKAGGDATGVLLSLIQSCRVLDIEPFEYLSDVLRRINGHRADLLHELLPHNWKPALRYYT